MSGPIARAKLKEILGTRRVEHVVVLGANGTMGYGSGALFTSAVPKVTFLARTRDKAEKGLAAAMKQVRSPTVADRVELGSYDADLERAVGSADLVFEAVTEQLPLKEQFFERVDAARRPDSIVATVTSGLSINRLAQGRSESFRRHFMGLHFFNPPNVIVGTELVAGKETDPALVDFVEAFATLRLGRVMVRTADTPGLRGQPRGLQGAERGRPARGGARTVARRCDWSARTRGALCRRSAPSTWWAGTSTRPSSTTSTS